MSFSAPSPQPFIPPAVPAPAPQLQPATQKPQRKAMMPSFISPALEPQAMAARSLVGGAGLTTGTTGGFGPGSGTYSG
jgi:hypothetical protein